MTDLFILLILFQPRIYRTVIEDVIKNVRESFLNEGVDEQVLSELKQVFYFHESVEFLNFDKKFNVDSFSIDQTYSYMPLKEFWRYPTFRIYLANECDGLMYEVFMCKWPFAGWSKKKLPILFFIPKLRFTIFFHIFQVV